MPWDGVFRSSEKFEFEFHLENVITAASLKGAYLHQAVSVATTFDLDCLKELEIPELKCQFEEPKTLQEMKAAGIDGVKAHYKELKNWCEPGVREEEIKISAWDGFSNKQKYPSLYSRVTNLYIVLCICTFIILFCFLCHMLVV